MKLISMTDFVLETFDNTLTVDFQVKVFNYANFLKQPLKLEMIVPCDEDGNVLEEPQPIYHKDSFDDCEDYDYDKTECNNYKKALGKVLFEINVLWLCVRFFALSECSNLAQCLKAKTDAKPLL